MQGTNPDSDAFFDEVSAAFTEKTGAKLNIESVQWADAHDRFVTAIAGWRVALDGTPSPAIWYSISG